MHKLRRRTDDFCVFLSLLSRLKGSALLPAGSTATSCTYVLRSDGVSWLSISLQTRRWRKSPFTNKTGRDTFPGNLMEGILITWSAKFSTSIQWIDTQSKYKWTECRVGCLTVSKYSPEVLVHDMCVSHLFCVSWCLLDCSIVIKWSVLDTVDFSVVLRFSDSFLSRSSDRSMFLLQIGYNSIFSWSVGVLAYILTMGCGVIECSAYTIPTLQIEVWLQP